MNEWKKKRGGGVKQRTGDSAAGENDGYGKYGVGLVACLLVHVYQEPRVRVRLQAR
jgi:hypothetical protein